MGLMASELRHRLVAAVHPAQSNRRSALELRDHRQQASVTTEGGILLAAAHPGVAGSLNPGTAAQQANGQQEQQERRSDRLQSSKRELLSRGRDEGPLLRELLGAGRLGAGRLPVGRLALKAASSAAGRFG